MVDRRRAATAAPSFFAILLLVACGGQPPLESYPADNRAGTSLAGEWELQGDLALIERQLLAAVRETDGVRDTFRPRDLTGDERPRSRDGRVRGGLVDAFFETGRRLRITQTPTALFINFDRSVVEEYRFGENRPIRVGQAEAQRVSGWDGADYVIETQDRSGMKLTERYQLGASGNVLTRRITFTSRGGASRSVIMPFRKTAQAR